MALPIQPVRWIGSARADLRVFPQAVRRDIGQALYAAQRGETYPSVKPLRGFGSASVLKVVATHATDSYRAVYTVRFEDVIYVLHAFQKNRNGEARRTKDMSSRFGGA